MKLNKVDESWDLVVANKVRYSFDRLELEELRMIIEDALKV